MSAPRIHIVSTMKNEGPYLVEWIAYHRMIGATDFTLFSNDCTDGTNLMLNRLDQMGIVHHFDNPIGPNMDPQRRAYSRANRMTQVQDADYVLVIDADEFLNVHVGNRTIPALIEACGSPDAISVNWRMMGSGGAKHWDDRPVTTRFTRGSTLDRPENGLVWGFKTLFRPEAFDYFGVHRPRFRKDTDKEMRPVWTNAAGAAMPQGYVEKGWRSNKFCVAYDFAQVNHYAVKSREEFLLKRLRGTANSKDKNRIDLGYWDKYDHNAQPDDSIRTDGLMGEIGALLSDYDLAALRRASLETARRTIATQLEEKELRDFIEGTSEEVAPA